MKTLFLTLLATVLLSTALFVTAASSQVAVCNPEVYGLTAELIACTHQLHGHEQWRHGQGTRYHTWDVYRYEAAVLRNYLRRLAERYAMVVRWAPVAQCESGGRWSLSTGNGYYGGLQFSLGTWRAYGGQGMPNEQPAWYQATIADKVRVSSGLQHWPDCGRRYAA
jgi:hypothetical protein